MTLKRALIAAGLAGLIALPVAAQPPSSDPIGDLLKKADPEEPDTAATGRRVTPDPTGPGADAAYDNRLKASLATARAFAGPLEGGWTLTAGGRDLYAFQLVDRGGSVEGAWRDLRRVGALDGSGYIDRVEGAGGELTFRFAGNTVAVLHATGGRWTGQLTEGGKTEAASLRRRP